MEQESRIRNVRVWTTVDAEEVKKRLLIIEDLYGACGNCKQLGLNFVKDRKCPACGAEFKYLATKVKDPGEIAKILKRIQKENLAVQLIDRDDFERAAARDAISNLFGASEKS